MSDFYKTLVDTLDNHWNHFMIVDLPPELADFTEEVTVWTLQYWYIRFAANHGIPIHFIPEFEPSAEAASIILVRIAKKALKNLAKGINNREVSYVQGKVSEWMTMRDASDLQVKS
jgi:hypothetical protein